MASASAQAQDESAPEATEGTEIVVTGIRASLANAQEIKRNADTVVDAITAQDIGALPDRSVTEALQRVPGVSINRFAGTNDPDHFSVEGSGVVIRGLNFVRSEFNGRDAFSAGVGGQSLNFADVPSELLGSVEIFKNATADMIEGGLAGTVNLNTRKPFDNKGFHAAFSVEANYGDFAREWTPTGSFLLSDTWDTGIGTIGLLGSASYSRIKSRADGIQITNFQTRDGTRVTFQSQGGQLICRNQLPASTDTSTLPATDTFCGQPSTPGADGRADLLPLAYAPIGGQYRSQDFDRKRDGIALAAQWESTDGDSLLTAQFIRSHTTNSWGEHTFETAPDLSEYNTYPLGCHQNGNGNVTSGNPNGGGNSNSTVRAECRIDSNGQFFFSGNDQGNGYNPLNGQSFDNYQYDADGLFESGYITLPGSGWRTAGSGNGANNWVPSGGMQQSLSRRQVFEENTIADYGLNFQTKLGDRIDLNLDANYTDSEHDVDDVSVFGSTWADQELDLTGNLPVVISHKPNTISATWAAPNPAIAAATDQEYFMDQRVQFWRAAMDHFEESDGREYALRGDLAYNFDDGSFIRRVKVGARYADRDQTVRYTTYNWGVLSEVWSGNGPPVSVADIGSDQVDFYRFQNFFRDNTPGPFGAYYYNGDLIKDYDNASEFLGQVNDRWHATNNVGANDWERAGDRVDAIAGTHYLPSEIQPLSQSDLGAYAMVNFETPDDGEGLRLAGNFGVRFVSTDITSSGSTRIPTQADLGIQNPYDNVLDPNDPSVIVTPGRCAPRVPAGSPPGTPATRPGGVCNLTPAEYADLQTWAGTTATFISSTAKNDYTYILPSLNMRLGVTEELLFRFAASKVLTRPDQALVRNFQTTTISGNGELTAQIGNPYLIPATAWQIDLTGEYYFDEVGSVTLNLFWKDVKNFFYQNVVDIPITNNGVTFPVQTRGPANYDGHGKIKGFEVAYQQTFDFLPEPFDGLGFNGNYSYINSSGLPNTFLNTGTPVNPSTIPAGDLPLEGLSKHNVNATIFYEKGPISVRAAYNWRSRFLLTAADVIFPYTSIFNEATGQLDASIFYSVTEQIKVGIQAVNILDEVTKTSQAYTGDPSKLAPRSYFMNDRRFSFIVRGNF
ncbi:TonB-dependent receptor [Altererythrobacter sp. Root672]|uniref:TonB-dependent receptor n=1 Tax=Altererythrobacter sp. Root672 TaxID=1736584 RepID=UPI0007018A6F|nr:TonB-dependent receptor [Altererythrobacter sp. Root672]KRA80595.1 TonB-dependent receptor [Altererythrobacter sp. Root672]